MITFGNIRPEQLGDIRALRVTDRLDTEADQQMIADQGHILADLSVPGIRKVTCDLLVRGKSETEVRLNLERVRRWLKTGSVERLMLAQMPGQYYLAALSEITAPVFSGHSARVSVTFTCRDHRPYNLYSRAPADGRGPETDNFTFGGTHVLRDMGCLFVLERETAVPQLSAYKLTIPGRPGTIRYEERLEPEERMISGTLYLLRDAQALHNGQMTNAETEARRRQIASWLLRTQRQDLVFDAAPDLTWKAEVVQGADLERNGWRNGRIRLDMVLEPLAMETERSYTVQICGGAGRQQIALHALFPNGMGFETPVNLTICNTGSQAVSDLRVYYPALSGTEMIRFNGNGFSLCNGAQLFLSSDERLASLNGEDANRYIASGDFPSLPPDEREIGIKSDAGSELSVTFTARPRWI